jgi:hypothetical protein
LILARLPDLNIQIPMEEANPPTQAKPARKWARIAIYLFAALGLLFSVLIAVVAFREKPEPSRTFDANEVVEGVMTRNYGKYSDTHRGWLYVDEETNRTYLVTVVQQKKVDGKEGDELYLVASGRTINSNSGEDSFYGVFQVRWSDDSFYEYGDARRPTGADPVTPERVLFEALSGDVWGWVVKTTIIETGDGSELTAIRNVVLAPRNDRIALLAEFNAAYDVLGGSDCEETERQYAAWKQAQDEPKTVTVDSEVPAETPAEEDGDGEDFEPVRCTKLQWTYRTDPVRDSTFTPLYITRKAGMRDGVKLEAKTWKVMFDPKSYTYLLPEELKEQGV